MEDERTRLRSAQPAVERDQLLEGTALFETRVVEAADHDVGYVCEPVRTEKMARGVRGEWRQGVLALDGSLGEVMGAGGAECNGTALRGANEEPADMRVRAERRNQPRVTLVDLLEREPARLLHQRDETEVARPEHDDLPFGNVLLRALDELVEAVPVALLERRTLCLPVIGEHDDLVRTRRIPAGAVDPAELLV